MSKSGKILFSVFTVIFLSLSSCSFAYDYVKGDVIVVLRNPDSGVRITASSFGDNGAGISAASSFAKSAGASLTKTYPALSEADNSIFAMIHSDDIDPEAFTQELLKNPDVVAASPNYIVKAAYVPNDTRYSELWGLEAIGMPRVWDTVQGSSNVYVAIIDSGIDWTNPELTDNVAIDLGFTASGIRASAYDGFDNYGHGTHVAGTIGAVGDNEVGIAGINWEVSMIPIKVLDATGSGTTDTVIEGMDYVRRLIRQGYNIRAINLSLEAYAPVRPTHDNLVIYPMWRAFKAVDEYNQAVIVVAAGNQGVAIGKATTYAKKDVFDIGCYAYPASFKGLDNMISVSATGKKGNIATYSNTNADISAPGGDANGDGSTILSTWIQSSSNGISFAEAQGTSMAAPHVAGAVAILAAFDSTMTAYQIKQCILDSRVSSNSVDGAAADSGLNILEALEYEVDHGSRLPAENTENTNYDDWRSYSNNNNDNNNDNNNNNNNSSGGGGGCNGFMNFAIALIFLCPIAKKFMS